ncbi:hypothetical protein [Virgibacillus siamensis]|uniref:hypothetical protein n=1 Tax=Virgibacillus siamensis TaxID=480071 RepID=UPI00098783F2|nr:hypothetical protein [Virgibacillus siamensis]
MKMQTIITITGKEIENESAARELYESEYLKNIVLKKYKDAISGLMEIPKERIEIELKEVE